MTNPTQVAADIIFGLPDNGRVGYVAGMNRANFVTYVSATASRLLRTFPATGLSEERLTSAMRKRVDALVMYNTRPPAVYEVGVDLADDHLESLFGTGSCVTGSDMMRAFTQPQLRKEEHILINYARLECLALTAKFLSDAGLRERALPLMAKYGEAYVDHVLDEQLGRPQEE